MNITAVGPYLQVSMDPHDVAVVLALMGPDHLKLLCPVTASMCMVDLEALLDATRTFSTTGKDYAEVWPKWMETLLGHADPLPGTVRNGNGIMFPVDFLHAVALSAWAIEQVSKYDGNLYTHALPVFAELSGAYLAWDNETIVRLYRETDLEPLLGAGFRTVFEGQSDAEIITGLEERRALRETARQAIAALAEEQAGEVADAA